MGLSKENLLPLNQRPETEAKAIQSKGGSAKSEAKRIANMTKNLKHGRYASKFTLLVQELASDPKASALKIFDLIERIKGDWNQLTPKLRMDLAKLYCEAHRTVHGTKQLSFNLDIELKKDIEAWFDEDTK